MRAIVAEGFGDPEVLKLKEMPKPVPGAGEVLVKVEAASVNPLDVQTRRGDYAEYVSQPFRLGVDVSGTVEAVGDGVEGFAPGDDVFYSTRVLENEGGYAEYHTERAKIIAKKPTSLSFAEAASMPIAASTAWVCLIERGRLKAGDRVLILGGSGGVGLFAVQIAKLTGAYVVTTCRKDAQGLVNELGADITLDYKASSSWEELGERREDGFDVIVDLIGGDAIARSLKLLAAGGRVISIVDQPQPHSLYAGWEVNAEIHLVFLSPSADRLSRLGSLANRGLLKPRVEQTLPLEQAAEAHRLIEAGGRTGKIVLVTS
ncbi:NADP-dependent oxidoreductase [Denitrobaculum tricleocarpae]|uniref:NADP-dependent oxidoreductase n=1 Tax=Denitrobaculum tricleocarpae TaxID=2591009 RepID=A0A545U2D9_9PROT|nr:NADP-dependent oxidoreductase [Denitrobaculum tricleocarpae]TQV83616.1 NADP-dependent oxidoreductase [Denitrobaculum tricleocarpae]